MSDRQRWEQEDFERRLREAVRDRALLFLAALLLAIYLLVRAF